MLKKAILKGLEKLGIKFKPGELKEKLEARLKRAEKKLAKKEAKVEPKIEEPKEEVVEEVEKVVEEKPKVWYWGQHRKIVRKFEDLGTGETKVYFDDSIEVVENSTFKANIKEE